MENKKPYLSKTLWVNLLVCVASFFPAVKAILTPEIALTILSVVNILLRVVTKKEITWGV